MTHPVILQLKIVICFVPGKIASTHSKGLEKIDSKIREIKRRASRIPEPPIFSTANLKIEKAIKVIITAIAQRIPHRTHSGFVFLFNMPLFLEYTWKSQYLKVCNTSFFYE